MDRVFVPNWLSGVVLRHRLHDGQDRSQVDHAADGNPISGRIPAPAPRRRARCRAGMDLLHWKTVDRY